MKWVKHTSQSLNKQQAEEPAQPQGFKKNCNLEHCLERGRKLQDVIFPQGYILHWYQGR